MFNFGVDYYPEQWPEERWTKDAELMAQAGFNVVRLAEFAWSRLEPEKGRFDFEWLDRAIALLAGYGMHIVLGTPTASPPPWLMAEHPEIFRVRSDGTRVTFGHRRGYCPNNPVYRDYSRAIVRKMAEHYSGNPAVVGWQIDNELGDRCYCPRCALAFHDWLRTRFGTLAVINDRWGTVFWSHVYTDWTQIPVPLTIGGPHNPGLALDYHRFCSDSYVDFMQIQNAILRQFCPDHFITHNFMGFVYDQINQFDLSRSLDFVSWDNYPQMQWNMKDAADPVKASLGHDTMRGLKRSPFWVIEQQAGPSGWEIVSPAPRPGQLRLWAYQAIAHGADGILFFRWRTAQAGVEQYWHGLLDHDGRPGRRYEEIRRMGGEIQIIGERLVGTKLKPQVAILLSYDSRFAFQIQANNPSFRYETEFLKLYRALQELKISVDIVSPEANLQDYKLVFAPTLHVLDGQAADNLSAYVSNGGVLVVTPRSGVKDEANRIVGCPLPGLLAELCGMEVSEYDSFPEGKTNSVRFTIPDLEGTSSPKVDIWADLLHPTCATVVAIYEHDYYAGSPAITLNHYGTGYALYMGVFGGQDLLLPVVRWLLQKAEIPLSFQGPTGVEILKRESDGRILIFILNHTGDGQAVDLPGVYWDLLHTSLIESPIHIGPYDVSILEQQG